MADEPDDCIARVLTNGRKSLNDVIDYMVAEGSGLTRPQALAYFEKLSQTVVHFSKEGYNVVTPLFRTKSSIVGIFKGKSDVYDPARHQINVNTTTGSRLRSIGSDMKTKKIRRNLTAPIPQTITDAADRGEDWLLTIGGIAMLKGYLLKFDLSDPRQGVFLASIDNPNQEIHVSLYSRIKPSEIHFQVPAIAPGEYILSVKAMIRDGKKIQKGELDHILIVSQ